MLHKLINEPKQMNAPQMTNEPKQMNALQMSPLTSSKQKSIFMLMTQGKEKDKGLSYAIALTCIW